MCECMAFPDTVEEFMNSYKIVDTEHVYTNGTEMVPIFRMRQWFEHKPTLCGYNIEHLELIARVLQKENLPPERVAEALADIGRIVSIVRDECEESLRKAVEQCMPNELQMDGGESS